MSAPRVCVALLLAVVCVRAFVPLPDGSFWVLVDGLFVLGPASIVFATQRERLRDAQRRSVPSNRLVALLASPFFDGGGRGALFLIVQLALVMVAMLLLRMTLYRWLSEEPWPGLLADDDPLQLVLVSLYAIVYVLLPAGLTWKWSSRGRVRWLTRAAIPVFAVLLFFTAVLGGGRFDSSSVGCPWIFGEMVTGAGEISDSARTGLWILIGTASLAIALNVPRMVAGVREVLAASAENREAARTSCAPPTSSCA